MGAFAALPRATFDPVRAHGAWVYLFAAALAWGASRKRRQLLLGLATAVLPPLAALGLGADRAFLVVAACAVLPAAGAVFFAARFGDLSPPALICGVGALTLAAPAEALVGGASAGRAVALLLLLWTFYGWRSLRIAVGLRGTQPWDRDELRARGLRKAAVAAV